MLKTDPQSNLEGPMAMTFESSMFFLLKKFRSFYVKKKRKKKTLSLLCLN